MINYQCNFQKFYLQMSFIAEYHNDWYGGNFLIQKLWGVKLLQHIRGGLKNWNYGTH